MKVLHVIDSLGLGGGAEHALATTLPLLRERGIDSSVVVLNARDTGLQPSIAEMGFDVSVLREGPLPARARALRRKLRSGHDDLVHSTLFHSCLLTRFACVGLPIAQLESLVNTSHDPVRRSMVGISAWKMALFRQIDRMTARYLGSHYHALSEAVEREAVTILGIPPERITVIPRGRSEKTLGNPSPQRRQRARKALGIDLDAPVVLTVGRQDHQKAQADLVRAFVAVHEELPHAVLLIAGREGNATPVLRSLVSESGLESQTVRFLGHRSDVAELYVAADLFVLPSLYEGLGSAMIEAMGLSTPVLGSDAPAIAEALDDGRYGAIFPRGDVPALQASLLRLLRDGEELQMLACRGYERFLQRYELETVVNRTVDLYQELANAET